MRKWPLKQIAWPQNSWYWIMFITLKILTANQEGTNTSVPRLPLLPKTVGIFISVILLLLQKMNQNSNMHVFICACLWFWDQRKSGSNSAFGIDSNHLCISHGIPGSKLRHHLFNKISTVSRSPQIGAKMTWFWTTKLAQSKKKRKRKMSNMNHDLKTEKWSSLLGISLLLFLKY